MFLNKISNFFKSLFFKTVVEEKYNLRYFINNEIIDCYETADYYFKTKGERVSRFRVSQDPHDHFVMEVVVQFKNKTDSPFIKVKVQPSELYVEKFIQFKYKTFMEPAGRETVLNTLLSSRKS